jgi:hypothetical protein
MKKWLQTLILLAGVLVVVGGVVLVLVTGFDLLWGSVGLLAIAGGLGLMWAFRAAASSPEHSTITSGRSFQRPLSHEEKSRDQFKGKI